MNGTVDLGSGHRLQFVENTAGEVCGAIHWHPRPDGTECDGGSIMFRGHDSGRGHEWDIVQEEPLTLSPSLLCRQCGSHGWVRNGKWVSE